MIAKVKCDVTYALEQMDVILRRMHEEGPVSASDLETLALIKHFHPYEFARREKELLYIMGLFYKVSEPTSIMEEVYSIYADVINNSIGKRFTPVQADAYRKIEEKRYFSFSAPTSAGKSYLFKELISNAIGDIVIVVPSRALIAEYLSAVKRLVDNSVLVLQFIDNVNIANTNRRIFVITPERGNDLFAYTETFNIQLFLFDEAQLADEKYRGIGFDAFVRRVSMNFPNSTKVFAHPFVENPEAQIQKHSFEPELSSAIAYEQKSVGKVFVTIDNGRMYYFSPYSKNQEFVQVERDIIRDVLQSNGTILIYASKSKIYSKRYVNEYRHYLRFCPKLTDENALKYVEAVRLYIGANKSGQTKKSLVVKLMERGIVIHHGSMPLRMRIIIEEFVRNNHARLCFATSTLKQGINMPFDAVFIDNYRGMDVLTLKNLIGRSGRSSPAIDTFEYGYTIVDKKHYLSFSKTMKKAYSLVTSSRLDANLDEVEEDKLDLVEAIQENTFDNEYRLTKTQIDRISKDEVQAQVRSVLDKMFVDDRIITGVEYYERLTERQRSQLKDAFKKIYVAHLRRQSLTSVEQSILSTSIPILLWHIQGKTFREVLALRYSYLTQRSEQRRIRAKERGGEISKSDADSMIEKLMVRFSQAPSALPNKQVSRRSDFGWNVPVTKLDYDTLVFDTYDYIDKVIGISLSDPLCAAFDLFYKNTGDTRAEKMSQYIRFGTNDPKEIWLLKYGFSFEEISWVKPYVLNIDEQAICFSDEIHNLPTEKVEIISRYL